MIGSEISRGVKAVALAVSALTLLTLPAGAAGGTLNFAQASEEAGAAPPQAAPQMAPEPPPAMPDEAPHITPVPEGQEQPRASPGRGPDQPTMPDEAPHITPVPEGAPDASTTQVPPD